MRFRRRGRFRRGGRFGRRGGFRRRGRVGRRRGRRVMRIGFRM